MPPGVKCKCGNFKILPSQEKQVITNLFIAFAVFQTIGLITLCGITIYYIYQTNVRFFLQVDLLSLVIAVVILGILILVVGWSSAKTDTWMLWLLFHFFMILLLLIEMILSWYSSDVQGFLSAARKTWDTGLDEAISEIEADLQCCGFANSTDSPVDCRESWENGCQRKLQSIMIGIRNTASVSLFVDFVFAMFLDFMGCAICFHPTVVHIGEFVTDDFEAVPMKIPFLEGEPNEQVPLNQEALSIHNSSFFTIPA